MVAGPFLGVLSDILLQLGVLPLVVDDLQEPVFVWVNLQPIPTQQAAQLC